LTGTALSKLSPRSLIKWHFTSIEWVIMSSHPRVLYRNIPGATEILTPDFLDFLANLDDAMHAQLAALRTARAKRLRQAAGQYATCVIAT
jgi:hypothetical protein